ncbi:MAG: Membrane carboxypeptidase/penicillin-binding protein PbpC [Candidatus Accumulibacter vicinus]|uniref:Membrane carboxypeptidase/penicillin-binding protein PbpC n=1 Tax=Candidatus Accumulibacter vicinus TaxID=2954382 RepID=A0A084Y264_9PROT|nr:MAG: Membrane carboxypeptidase/penicillin-binding protein PbpC [Candidatus Accumulibacter vicinus]
MAVRPRIESPANGAIYAVDPDIPRDRQRLTLMARAAARTAVRGHWFELDDGTRLRADALQLWPPTPGRHEVVLVDAKGTELDRVRFEVRGLRRSGSGPASSH